MERKQQQKQQPQKSQDRRLCVLAITTEYKVFLAINGWRRPQMLSNITPHICIHLHMLVYICMYACTFARARTCTSNHTGVHMSTCKRAYTYIYIYASVAPYFKHLWACRLLWCLPVHFLSSFRLPCLAVCLPSLFVWLQTRSFMLLLFVPLFCNLPVTRVGLRSCLAVVRLLFFFCLFFGSALLFLL